MLLADLSLLRGVLTKLLRQLLELDLQAWCIGVEPFWPLCLVRLQLLVCLSGQGGCLLYLVFQRLLQMIEVLEHVLIQQSGKERILIGKTAG